MRRFIGNSVTGKLIVLMKVVQPHTAFSVGNYATQPRPMVPQRMVVSFYFSQVYKHTIRVKINVTYFDGCKGEIFFSETEREKKYLTLFLEERHNFLIGLGNMLL